MRQLEGAALSAAVVLSAVLSGGAVLRAPTGVCPPWDDELGTGWAVLAVEVLLLVTFGLLAVVLVRHAHRIDDGSGARRWVRRTMVACLGVLCLGFPLS